MSVRRARSLTALVAALALLALGLTGCGEGGGATTGKGPDVTDLNSLTCNDLTGAGGFALQTAATELAAKAKSSGQDPATAMSSIETMLISGCRQEPGSFHPAQPALKEYEREHGGG